MRRLLLFPPEKSVLSSINSCPCSMQTAADLCPANAMAMGARSSICSLKRHAHLQCEEPSDIVHGQLRERAACEVGLLQLVSSMCTVQRHCLQRGERVMGLANFVALQCFWQHTNANTVLHWICRSNDDLTPS